MGAGIWNWRLGSGTGGAGEYWGLGLIPGVGFGTGGWDLKVGAGPGGWVWN